MKTLLIDALYPQEVRVATMIGKDVVQCSQENESQEELIGNIYLAKISRIEPSLRAAFIEYEQNKYGFLPFSDISVQYYNISDKEKKRFTDNRSIDAYKHYKIHEVISKNQRILVYLTKEGRGNKVPSFSTNIHLVGFFCIFTPNNPQTIVSRNVQDTHKRKKLKELALKVSTSENHGLIVKDMANICSIDAINADYANLCNSWNNIESSINNSNFSRVIRRESNISYRTIRDLQENEITTILVDGESTYRKVVEWVEPIANYVKVKLHDIGIPIFTYYNIENTISLLYNHKVDLPSGGYIVINLTEALVSIDVNSGKMTKEKSIEETAYKTNIEAAYEVVRQVKLRNLSGLIIVDFIDMLNYKHHHAIEDAIESACKHYNIKLQISSISSLGLMQISRQRIRRNIVESNTTVCVNCSGNGYVLSMESTIANMIRQLKCKKMGCTAINIVASQELTMVLLNEKRHILYQIENDFNLVIGVNIGSDMLSSQFTIEHICLKQSLDYTKVQNFWLNNWYQSVISDKNMLS